MSEDSRRESGTHPHCADCWAICYERSTLRFYAVDGNLFCELCIADIGRDMLMQLDVEAIMKVIRPDALE